MKVVKGSTSYKPNYRRAAVHAAVQTASWAAKQAAQAAFRNLFGSKGTQTQGKNQSGVAVSYHHDTKQIYKKKYMPKKKKKRWVKFIKRVDAVSDSRLPKQVMMTRITQTLLSVIDKQAFSVITLAGNETSYPHLNMLNTNILGAAGTVNERANIKYRLLNQYVSITMSTPTGELDDQSQEVDIYEFICRKDLPLDTGAGQAITSIAQLLGYVAEPPSAISGGTVYDIQRIGTTPFDNPIFCRYFKITKVTKHLVGNGRPFIYEMRVRKNYSRQTGLDETVIAKKGLTRGIVIVTSGVYNGAANPAVYLNCEAVYNYRYKQINPYNSTFTNRP